MTHRKVQKDIETQTKSRRSDYGTYKVTNRDWDGLRFVAEMKFVRFDTLGEYLAPGFQPANDRSQTLDGQDTWTRHHGGKRTDMPWPSEYRKRLNAVAQVVSRWEHKMGFAETWQPFASQAKWVRIYRTWSFRAGSSLGRDPISGTR